MNDALRKIGYAAGYITAFLLIWLIKFAFFIFVVWLAVKILQAVGAL